MSLTIQTTCNYFVTSLCHAYINIKLWKKYCDIRFLKKKVGIGLRSIRFKLFVTTLLVGEASCLEKMAYIII